METTEGHIPKKKHYSGGVIVIIIVALLVGVFFIRPGIIGYGVYQQVGKTELTVEDYGKNLQDLTLNFEKAKTNLTSYAVFSEQLFTQIDEVNDKLTNCLLDHQKAETNLINIKLELNEKEEEIKSILKNKNVEITKEVEEETAYLKEEKVACLENVNEKETELNKIQNEYEGFVKKIARSVCCKEKVDNDNINFYEVIGDQLKCLDFGRNKLDC